MKLIFTRKLKKCFLQFPHFTKLLLLGGYLEETVSLDAVLLALSSPLSLCSSKEDCWKEHRLGTELEKFHPNPSSRRRQWHPTPVLLPGKSHGFTMEEPGRLQSMGSIRVRHDWANSLSLFTFMHWRRKWQPTPVFLPGESQGRGSLVGFRLWGRTESDMTEAT